MSVRERLLACTGFQWDRGNAQKNWLRHRVTRREAEEVFFSAPLLLHDDEGHSGDEPRWVALGVTDEGRLLFVAFTIRGELLRVISSREATRRERQAYEASFAQGSQVPKRG